MRLLHTSDWHLGHALKDVPRDAEHAAFLAWLLETCAREKPDALLITGDVFDSATPPASAERMWFEFLAACKVKVVAIAGNHDSPARLGAASPVLAELGVTIVGGGWQVVDVGGAVIAAVPFLRAIELPDGDDPMAQIYASAIAEATAVAAGRPVIATGHLYATGADPSHLSERRISIGGQESASLRMFPETLAYVALGHMHRAQRVGRDSIRYAGAPIPLALDESSYKHSVVLWEDGAIRLLPIPRLIDVMQIRGNVVQVLAEIAMLPSGADPLRPYLEIIVRLDKPEPRLRAQIETALDGKRARLVRLATEATGHGEALAERTAASRLAELDPRDVFRQCWSRQHADAPPADVLAAFDRLLEVVA